MMFMSYFLHLLMIHQPPLYTHTYIEFSIPAREMLWRDLHLVALEMEILWKVLRQPHRLGLVDQFLHKEQRRQYNPPTAHLATGPVQARLPYLTTKHYILLTLKSPILMLNYLLSSATSLVKRQVLSIRKALPSCTIF